MWALISSMKLPELHWVINCIIQQAQSGTGQGAAKSQKRLTQMVALMVTCFLVAWLPYALVSVIVMAGGVRHLSATATTVPALLAKSSLIYNPIIYAFMNPQVTVSQAFVINFVMHLQRECSTTLCPIHNFSFRFAMYAWA